MEVVLDKLNPWGEPTPGFLQFMDTLTELESNPIADPQFPEVKNYKAPDGSVYNSLLIRGVYEAKSFQAKPDDIFVMSFPKTGTTWTQELVYLIATDCDFEGAKTTSLEQRFPFMEFPLDAFSNLAPKEGKIRFVKTHLSYANLPSSVLQIKPKIVYIARNPKDTAISMFHFYTSMKTINFKESLEYFINLFVNDKVIYSPMGKHVLDMWERRHQENILFLTYEELQRDLCEGVRKIAKFLGKSLSEGQVKQVAFHCSFGQMKANDLTNYKQWEDFYENKKCTFMREGKSGNWKSHFTEEMNEKLDKWIEKNFVGSNFQFQYEV